MNKIILSAENSHSKHLIELSEDCSLDEIFNAFKAILIGLTWNNITIDNHIKELAETL
jgi:hypothetical protein